MCRGKWGDRSDEETHIPFRRSPLPSESVEKPIVLSIERERSPTPSTIEGPIASVTQDRSRKTVGVAIALNLMG
jgi:hypothetical protein